MAPIAYVSYPWCFLSLILFPLYNPWNGYSSSIYLDIRYYSRWLFSWLNSHGNPLLAFAQFQVRTKAINRVSEDRPKLGHRVSCVASSIQIIKNLEVQIWGYSQSLWIGSPNKGAFTANKWWEWRICIPGRMYSASRLGLIRSHAHTSCWTHSLNYSASNESNQSEVTDREVMPSSRSQLRGGPIKDSQSGLSRPSHVQRSTLERIWE